MSGATELTVRCERFPLAQPFTISRGSKTAAEVVVVEVRRQGVRGWGECVPYARYGESVEGTVAALKAVAGEVAAGLDRAGLQQRLPAGAARNALDCALWDLEARCTGSSVAQVLGLAPLRPVPTAYTLSLDTPERMAEAARQNAHRPLLKSKLGGAGDLERVAAIRAHAPAAKLIVDANEGWSAAQVEPLSQALGALGVALIEQPLPAARDAVLAELVHPVPLCADESCHTATDVDRLVGRYELVNLKLDKTGGLTEALRVRDRARACGLGLMAGCMVATSLAMAPAVLLAQTADYVDLDGPLLLARDRQPGLRFEGSLLHPPSPELWGGGTGATRS
ncbi:MAG: N-acetyl-D-Glu racemase DgcA [Candidatus Latescibacterota bacterium]